MSVHPKQHLDLFSHFCTVKPRCAVWQTDRLWTSVRIVCITCIRSSLIIITCQVAGECWWVVILHYIKSYLEWPKVQILLNHYYHYYTRRTRSRKQLGRKWSGKEVSFEVVSKNGQCWSWGDIRRQTIPEAATGNAWSATVDSHVCQIIVGCYRLHPPWPKSPVDIYI